MADFVFLVCSERSGSNFITSLMNGHTAVCGPPPTHLFRLFASNMDRYGDLEQDGNWAQLTNDMAEAFATMLGDWNSAIDANELATATTTRSSAALLRYIYEKEAALDGASQIFVKENHTHLFAPFLMAHFPQCRFLALVRDPRDVALSWKNTPTIPRGIAQAVNTWLADQSGALSLYHQLRGSGRCRLVRYEDLLQDTEAKLGTVLSWMDLRYSADILQFHRDKRTRRNASRISAWDNLGTGVMHNNHAKYLTGLSPDEIRYIELRCAHLMRVFDYPLSEADESADEGVRQAQICQLEALLDPGEYALEPAESAIRQKRLDTIRKILNRRPACLIPAAH